MLVSFPLLMHSMHTIYMVSVSCHFLNVISSGHQKLTEEQPRSGPHNLHPICPLDVSHIFRLCHPIYLLGMLCCLHFTHSMPGLHMGRTECIWTVSSGRVGGMTLLSIMMCRLICKAKGGVNCPHLRLSAFWDLIKDLAINTNGIFVFLFFGLQRKTFNSWREIVFGKSATSTTGSSNHTSKPIRMSTTSGFSSRESLELPTVVSERAEWSLWKEQHLLFDWQ